MQIGAISSLSSIIPAYSPVLAAQPVSSVPSALPSIAASGTSSHAPTSTPQQPAPSDTASISNHRTYGGEAGAASATADASATAVEQVLGVYSASVGGHQFAGTVEEGNGVYTVSVPNIPGPGATASGTSEIAAETNLGTVIDELV
jgi:hypothetical protein